MDDTNNPSKRSDYSLGELDSDFLPQITNEQSNELDKNTSDYNITDKSCKFWHCLNSY